MTFTLPLEQLSQLQVSIQVSLPTGATAFEFMPGPAVTSPPIHPSANSLKLHVQEVKTENRLSFRVWISGFDSGEQQSTKMTISQTVPDTTSSTMDEEMTIPPREDLHTSSKHLANQDTIDSQAAVTYESFEQVLYRDNQSMNHNVPGINDSQFLISADYDHCANENELSAMLDAYEASQLQTPFRSQLESNTDLDLSMFSDEASTQLHNLFYAMPQVRDTNSAIGRLPTSPSEASTSDTINTPSSSTSNDPENGAMQFSISSIDTAADPTDDPKRPFPCQFPGCNRRFTREYTSKVHMSVHTRPSEGRFTCSVQGCEEHFSRKHDRMRHEAGKHGITSPWSCALCKRFFSSSNTLDRHITDKHSGK